MINVLRNKRDDYLEEIKHLKVKIEVLDEIIEEYGEDEEEKPLEEVEAEEPTEAVEERADSL